MTTDAHTEQPTGGVAEVTPAAPVPPQNDAPQYEAPQYGAPQYEAPQYGAPQYEAPQYGAPQYATPTMPERMPGQHSYGFAIASFVIGIASIVAGWTLIAPAVGLVLGIIAIRRNTSERTLALWGVWLNGAILAFAAIGIVILIGLASFGLLAGTLASFSW